LRQTTVTLPEGWTWQEPANGGAASRHENQSGEELILDVVVPANIQPGKATIKVKNTSGKEESRNIDIIASPAPAPTITKFQMNGVDVESGPVGQTIVIIGQHLKAAKTEVKFGPVVVTVPSANIQDSQITLTIPAGLTPSAERIDVTVTTTPGGTATKKFTITAP
jgi:hypothetical protein